MKNLKCYNCGCNLDSWLLEHFIAPKVLAAPDRGTPHRCVKCDGSGGYGPSEASSSSAKTYYQQQCPACAGTGILWSRA